MKRILIIVLFIAPFWISGQGQTSEESAKPLKNSLSLSGGTSFCKDRFFNPTYEVQYSRFLWKQLYFTVGYNWQHHTIEKVNYTMGESKGNYYYAFTGYLGLGWKFDITECFSLLPSVTWGHSYLFWDYYASHSQGKRRSHSISLSAEYEINRHWSAFGKYSYNIQGKDIYLVWNVWNNESQINVENGEFAKTGATNEFNCHDLKFGISFKF